MAWRMATKDEMVAKVCELYEKNGVSYDRSDVENMSVDELKDAMVEYADI